MFGHEAILGLLIPFIGTSTDPACVFFMKKNLSKAVQRALTGFAAGVMVAASIWSLLIPAMEQSEMVFRDVVLFDDTVMENIRLGRHGASDKEVRAAAAAANCDEFVNKLPQGYDTPIGENGAKLSGGERQRISIARALLKDAPIVLLDEATASLDVENETKVQGALSRLLTGKTVLVIAHRMPHCYCGELRLIYNGKVMLRNEVDVAFAEYATNGKNDNILHGKKYNVSM